MAVNIHVKNQSIIAYIDGEIDHHTAKNIRQNIDDSCLRVNPDLLVLDFGQVTFMDSSGIGLVMGRYKLMQEIDGKIMLTNTPPNIAKMMKLGGLEKIVAIDTGGKQNETD